jgi:protein-tyrosine phosphatase
MAGGQFEVVFVCTGNRFRSAIAEALLAKLTQGLPVKTSSAGTLDLGPVAVLPEAVELAPELGIDLADHRARCVRNVDLSGADLVLGFERMHLALAVVECGAPRERTFTLPELVSLLPEGEAADADPVSSARQLVRRAHGRRTADRQLELADPLGATPNVFRSTATEIQRLVERLASGLFGAGRRGAAVRAASANAAPERESRP